MRSFSATLGVLALTALAAGQTSVFLPDNQAAVGTCNAIPFSSSVSYSAGYTYLVRFPASLLTTTDTRLNDISLAPCGSGVWSAPTAIVGVGHLPATLPGTFAFPTAANIGSFLDFTVIWDSAVQGPFSWTATQDTWSPWGFAASGGTGFTWNGVDDIGFYVTFQGSTITSATNWTGTCHRTSSEPFRLYASGYQALSSTGSGNAGAKVELSFVPAGPLLYQVNSTQSSLDIGGVVGNGFAPAITTLAVGAASSINSASTNVGAPWEAAFVLAPVVPFPGGGLATPGGQRVNIDLFNPTTTYYNGGVLPSFAGNYPGTFSLPFSIAMSPLTVSMQQLNFDPVHPDGFVLSQAAQLSVP